MNSSTRLALATFMIFGSLSTLHAQSAYYNFGTSSGTLAVTTNTAMNITASSVGSANRVEGSSAVTSNVNASSGYTGASGDYNYAINGIIGGSLNLSSSTYFSFTLTPSAGYAVKLTDLQFGARIANVAETPTTFSIYASGDSFGSSTLIGSGTFTKGSWSLYTPTITSFTTELGSALQVRVYFSGGSANSTGAGHNRIDDLMITAVAVPEPGEVAIIISVACMVMIFAKHRRRLIM